MSKESTANSGIGVFGALGVLFVALKLIGVITWSWWWVLLPFWGIVGIIVAILIVLGIIGLIVRIFNL